MAASSTEQQELQLVERVEFRILEVANKENQLHELLQRYLPPLILKAASQHASVRTKIIRTLATLTTFIQPPAVVLPVKALLEQYKSTDSPIIKQFDLSFILHSVQRLDVDDRRDIVSIALRGCSNDAGSTRAATFFNVILLLLLDVRIPSRGSKEDEAFRASIGLEDEADAKYLSKAIALFLRLRVPAGMQTLSQSNPTFSPEELAFFPANGAGMEKTFQRISELKAKLVTLLASAAFADEEKFLPALFASSSPDSRVSTTGEEIIKRSSVSMEDPGLVNDLFKAHLRLPAPYRIRILGMLAKSVFSTTLTSSIMDAVALDFAPSQSETPTGQALQPASALERTKLHNALFHYLAWVARNSTSKSGFSLGPQLIERMRSYIVTQGWPISQQASHDEVSLRSRAYETIGMLAPSANLTVTERLDLAEWLFTSLAQDPTNDMVVNIDGALSSLTANIPPAIGGKEETLRTLLLTHMAAPEEAPAVRSTRHAAVKWANQCLPFSDIHGRWIDILAVAGRPNERSDVIEQGHKGLDPWTYSAHSDTKTSIPDWKEMATTYFDTPIQPFNVPVSQPVAGLVTLPNKTVFQNFHSTRIMAFPLALRYCKHMMLLSALDDFNVQPDWMQALDALVKTDITTRDKVRAYLRSIDSAFVVFYLKACLDGAFLRGAIGYLAEFSSNLLPLIKSNDGEIRALSAKALGILAAHPANDPDSVGNWCKTLGAQFANATNVMGPDLNAAEGALLAYGYLCSRSVFYSLTLTDLTYPFELLVGDNIAPSLLDAALEAFSQLWLAKLAVPPSEGDHSLENVIKKLSEKAKKGNEKAIGALGKLAAALPDLESTSEDGEVWSRGALGTILKELFALHEIKRVEVHFTVGDAITAAIARWDSNYVKITLDVEPRSTDFQSGARESLVASVLEKLFQDCKATKPSLLKASGIWLFCIVQYCSHLSQVQSRLRYVQAAFMRLLSARDELVQETASRGLSLVYERGDADLKSALVKDLVSAFTGSSTQLKVDNETELFEPGALPTGEGGSITSYKDIVNLANEVGDQRLVYKFMSLAANAATWSTRSAFGRFGLSNILSDSEVDPKLYPKLYRYRFDPNNNVQRSMDDIWKALVKDSSATLETHFDAIMEDLLKSILGREWRVREASCGAISDLVSGRPFPQYEKYYRDIWTAALKVLDDVKGSVREAALRLCIALSNTLVRQLEEGTQGAAAKAMMQEALPFLLSDKGAESSVQEVQVFATITVLKIAKHGGKNLKPFIADMIPQLLGLLSTIEPQQINYHYQRVGEDSRDKIDKLRSQMVNQSPISEAIENILRFIDEDVMNELAPRLENTIKTTIGMPTKIGCSRVLTTLFTRHTNEIKSVSGRFLDLLGKQVLDKNDEVSQAYARAAAYIMRVVPDDVKHRFSERLVNLYLQAEEEIRRQKVSDVVVSLAKVSPDHFTTQETVLLPFAYLGSHDSDEYASKIFKEVWNQHSGSSRTVVRYVPEIVALVERCLDTTQWALRHTAAFTVAAMVSDAARASDATGSISEANLKTIWPVFDKTLALKTFPGKEKLLEAYPEFVEKGKPLWGSDSAIAAQMKKIAIREAKRNNEEYRVYAFRCLWRFVKSRGDLDILKDIADIVSPHLDELKDGDKMEIDSKEDLATKTAKNGLEAVARGYNRSANREVNIVVGEIAKILKPYLMSPKYDAIKREVWYECVCDLMADITPSEPHAETSTFDSEGVLLTYLGSLDVDKAEVGTEAQRLRRANAVSATLKAHIHGVFGKSSAHMEELEGAVNRAIQEERVPEVQRAWQGVLQNLHDARRQNTAA
ncbi:Proteasome component ECM29 [Cladobotryum mycophilum]|uniref:Proteasome component ECM29 n=1 Tax=Cladobotryum mycophilum TaxID=491253 RepID=A0ABR0S9P1_9HYPO